MAVLLNDDDCAALRRQAVRYRVLMLLSMCEDVGFEEHIAEHCPFLEENRNERPSYPEMNEAIDKVAAALIGTAWNPYALEDQDERFR